MSSEPAIRAQHVSKTYELGRSGRTKSILKILEERARHPIHGSGEKRERINALDDVSFDVQAGEVVGVIGRNGAGKSTLLKIISRITPPSEGSIDLIGTVGSLLEVGTGFHPELTGLENVYLNGTILGMSRRDIDRRLDEIIEFSEVNRFLDTPVKRYSSGMRVRLAFAVAAHLDPDVLIIDEVLSVGDRAFQAKCLERMRSIAADQGRTVLYVSHNLVTVEHLCPRTLLFVDGQLAFDGDTADALLQYVSQVSRMSAATAPGVFDLAGAPRRDGTAGPAVLRQLVLRPGGGEPADTVPMGRRLQMEVQLEGFADIVEPNVQVTIGTTTTQCIFRMTSRMMPLHAAHDRQSDETIVIDIPSLALTPAEYVVNVSVFDLVTGTLLDEVENAAEFAVISSDVLGSGYAFDAVRDGQVMVPFDWELRPTTGGPTTSVVAGLAGGDGHAGPSQSVT